MRFMILVKANKDSEAGVMPSTEILTEMGKFNEELVKAGVLLAGEGLHPSSKGARVRCEGLKRTVIDGLPSPKPRNCWPGSGCCRSSRRKRPSSGSSAAPSRRARSRSARCSKPPTSVIR